MLLGRPLVVATPVEPEMSTFVAGSVFEVGGVGYVTADGRVEVAAVLVGVAAVLVAVAGIVAGTFDFVVLGASVVGRSSTVGLDFVVGRPVGDS